MHPDEYTRMFELEEHYWWFVARRNLAISLLCEYFDAPKPPLQLLDVGCGTSVVSREMSKFSNVISLDFSILALKFSKQRALRWLVRGDATHLPLDEAVVDAVVGLDIFEHVENDDLALQEAHRVLRPGGILILSVPAFRSLWGPHDVALHHHRRYRRQQVRRKLVAAGFQIERCSHSVFLLFPLVVLSRLAEKLKPGEAKASLPAVPGWLNSALIKLQAFEAMMIWSWKWDLPWGSSIVAVARKPR